jgi:tight adherence protein C
MKTFLGGLLLLLSLVFGIDKAFAQAEDNLNKETIQQREKNTGLYRGMSPREILRMYEESCNNENQASNCYQAALEYKKFIETNPKAKPKYDEYINLACTGGEQLACLEKEDKLAYEGSNKLFYASLGFIGLAVFLIARTIFQDEDQFQAQEKLDDNKINKDELAKHGIILKYSRPFFKRYFSPILNGMKNKKAIKEKYKRQLASAGLTNVLTPEDFYSFKLFLIIGFPITFLGVRAFLEETWPLSIIPIISIVGFYYPDFWVKGKIQQRQKEVISNMPFCVDMLALSVEAGLDFIAAMAKVNEKASRNALTEEFEIVIKEIKIGASRAEALRNLAWRIDLIQISSFSATLVAADSVGASIGPILKALSLEVRQKRSSEIEKAGATAATKILFPMMFLIVPAVMIIVAAPLILEWVGR